MRNYIANEVQSRQAYGSVTWLVRLVVNMRMRKTLRTLRKFSDHQLRDIGLNRSELDRLIAAPLDTDHSWYFERRNAAANLVEKICVALPNLGRANFFGLRFT